MQCVEVVFGSRHNQHMSVAFTDVIERAGRSLCRGFLGLQLHILLCVHCGRECGAREREASEAMTGSLERCRRCHAYGVITDHLLAFALGLFYLVVGAQTSFS
jgi:hypothetical protein